MKSNPPSPSARRQREYRHRLDRGEIEPHVPVGPRVIELLILLSIRYGGLSPAAAEARSRDRQWVAGEIARLLEKLADDLGVPK
jgi:hypothetical protein